MKVSELMAQLKELQGKEGDVQVGFQDGETGAYLTVDKVEIRDREVGKDRRFGYMFDDDEELGLRFIGLA